MILRNTGGCLLWTTSYYHPGISPAHDGKLTRQLGRARSSSLCLKLQTRMLLGTTVLLPFSCCRRYSLSQRTCSRDEKVYLFVWTVSFSLPWTQPPFWGHPTVEHFASKHQKVVELTLLPTPPPFRKLKTGLALFLQSWLVGRVREADFVLFGTK